MKIIERIFGLDSAAESVRDAARDVQASARAILKARDEHNKTLSDSRAWIRHAADTAEASVAASGKALAEAVERVAVEHGAIELQIRSASAEIKAAIAAEVARLVTNGSHAELDHWRREAARWQRLAESNYGALQTERALVAKLTQRLNSRS